ncbi:hypothetical protein T03_8707 [Trichinella britovi]|uniref:CCHC-type domain-containing protein n=1 Tax=Trichinella britovi TaxID=45882 RepID=A0A0V1D3P0_TRIBR|nr:hypothetical protein T03_8707 [Trichinella britovi]
MEAAETIELVSWRAWSASAVTIRTWKMATRRRDRASEDEPAKSSGRTGADPEEAKYPAQRVVTVGACPEIRTSVYTRRILLLASCICPEMDAKEWLKKLEDFFRASGVPTMDYGAVRRYLLTDSVRRELYPAGQATDDSFEELKKRLLNAYGPEESLAMLTDRFHALRQRDGQSIQQFAQEVAELGRRAGVSERDLVTRFSGGVTSSEVYQAIRLQEPPTLAEARKLATKIIQVEDGYQEKQQLRAGVARTEKTEMVQKIDAMIREMGNLAKKVEQLERAAPRPPRTAPGCFRCGSLDHLRRDCSQLRTRIRPAHFLNNGNGDRRLLAMTELQAGPATGLGAALRSGPGKGRPRATAPVWMQVPEKTKLGAYWDGPYAPKLPEHWDLEVLTHSGQREPTAEANQNMGHGWHIHGKLHFNCINSYSPSMPLWPVNWCQQSTVYVRKLICDFETTLIPVLQGYFPNTLVQGCYFNFCQAVHRKLIRILLEAGTTGTLAALFQYFRQEWMTDERLPLWNVRNVNVRTNNNLEGWHNRLNRKAGKVNGFYELLELLIAEQGVMDTLIQQVLSGNVTVDDLRRVNKVYAQKQRQVAQYTGEYTNGRRTLEQFLEALIRCDLARGWWPNVAGRTRTIPAYRRPDRYLGVWRPRPGSKRPLWRLRMTVCTPDNGCLRHCASRRSAPWIANSPAVSELLIGGPNEPPAWAADPSSIYRATNERRDYYSPNKTNVYSRGSFCLHSTLHDRHLDNPVLGWPRKPTSYSPLSFCPTSERLAKLYLSISSVQNPYGSYTAFQVVDSHAQLHQSALKRTDNSWKKRPARYKWGPVREMAILYFL